MGTTPMIAPDGRSGDIPKERVAEATKAGFKAAVAMISPDGKLGYLPADRQMDAAAAGFRPYDKPNVTMKESAAPKLVRGATATLPAIGATGGGALASPGIVTSALGAALGAGAGKQVELLTNRAIFGPDETAPASAKGLIETGENMASYAVPTAAMETGARLALGQPLQTGFSIAPPFTQEELAAQRAATRAGQEETAQGMAKGYKPADEWRLSQAVEQGRASRIPARIAGPAEVPQAVRYAAKAPMEPQQFGPALRGAIAPPTPTPSGPRMAFPSFVPEAAGVSGTGGEAWSMKRGATPELQRAVAAGDPGAIAVARRLNPGYRPIIIPKGVDVPIAAPGNVSVIAPPQGEDEEIPFSRDRAAD